MSKPEREQNMGPPQSASDKEDYTPNSSRSLPLSPQRQSVVNDILALYCCQPTRDRVKRYAPDCVFEDMFGYADNRYKVAGQWFALPKLFKESENLGCEVVTNDPDVIQFKNKQRWTFRLIPKSVSICSLISLRLDPETVDHDFIQVKHHKEQTSEGSYSHEGLGFNFKKWQADNVPKYMNNEEVEYFKDH